MVAGAANVATQVDYSRLDAIGLGEALFSQRSVRRFKRDPIAMDDLRLLFEAAVKAPNGGNSQPGRFILSVDRDVLDRLGALYKEAWWAKRRDGQGWTKPEDIPPEDRIMQAAARLADEIKDVPAVVTAWSRGPGGATSVLPAVQNLMLAARALGIGSVPTQLHPQVMGRVCALLNVPDGAELHFLVPLGYPLSARAFGGSRRLPTSQTTYLDRWGEAVPWK